MKRILIPGYMTGHLLLAAQCQPHPEPVVIDETGNQETVESIIAIDSVFINCLPVKIE